MARRTTRRRPTRRRSYRRNPAKGIVKSLTDGAVNAGHIVLGKAGARLVPDALNLPRTGATGLAVQAAVAVGLGMLADGFMPKRRAELILAGALTAPVESIIAGAGIPLLSPALSGYGMGAYVPRSGGVRGYVPTGSAAKLGAYVPAAGRSSAMHDTGYGYEY